MSPNGPRSTVVQAHRRRGRSLNSLAIQLSAFALTFILIALLARISDQRASAPDPAMTSEILVGGR